MVSVVVRGRHPDEASLRASFLGPLGLSDARDLARELVEAHETTTSWVLIDGCVAITYGDTSPCMMMER